MPRRLAQTPAAVAVPLEVSGRRVVESHAAIISILRSRLGQAHADLLATAASAAAGGIEWSTHLTGDIVEAADLPDPERVRIEQKSNRLLSDIRGLGVQLRAEDGAALMVGQMLEQVATVPPGAWLYSVGGKPVLVLWGHHAAIQPTPARAGVPAPAVAPPGQPVTQAVPPVMAAGPGTGSTGGPAVGVIAAAPASRRMWVPGMLLLIGLAAALLLGLRGCEPRGGVREDVLQKEIAAAEAANKTLADEIAAKRAKKPQFECVREPPSKAEAPTDDAPKDEPKRDEPRLGDNQEAPEDPARKKVAAAGRDCGKLQQILKESRAAGAGPDSAETTRQATQALQQYCRDSLIREAKNLCPGQRPQELVPELALVFDASNSMGRSLDFALSYREPTRMSAAKSAALALVQRAPSDANIGLVRVEGRCSARSSGMFPPSRRGQLTAELKGLEPDGGTPLADGVTKAGRLIDGTTREALMVVISDGAESCGRDPCAVAQSMKRAKPYLKINVIDITGTGAANCLAQITGGRVFTARDANEVATMTREASREAMAPAHCTKQ